MLLDKVIAGALVLLSAYMMSHAILLPIGWNGETGGPGGGAFPFWCSLIILVCAVFVILRPAQSYDAAQFTFDRVAAITGDYRNCDHHRIDPHCGRLRGNSTLFILVSENIRQT